MNIKTAVENALKQEKHITNSHYKKAGIKFLPTNTDFCIICIKKKSSYVRWQPKADDLIDDTWELVD